MTILKTVVCAITVLMMFSSQAYASQFESSVYLPKYTAMTWNDAESYCEQHGGHLVTIASSEENKFVSSLFGSSQSFWIGATDTYDGGFSWVTGESVTYKEPYECGEPSEAAKYVVSSGSGAWTNLRDREMYFVCEWDVSYPDKSDNAVTVRVNGVALNSVQEPIIKDDTTFVPLRAICEAIGLEVEWHADTQSIALNDVKYGGGSTWMKIDSTAVESGGGVRYAASAPFLLNGTTMVPLRVIGETYGDVLWDDATKTVDVFSLY